MTTLKRMRERWWHEQYHPGALGLLINPFYFARRGLLAGLRPYFSELSGEVLDVGCGSKPYRALVPAIRYTGLDVDNPFTRKVGTADVFYDGGTFPFPDASFDAVFCSQVLEHVFNPESFLSEIRRVLRPEGKLLLTVPFAWDEHEQPNDYARYSSFGLVALLDRAGFEVLIHNKTVDNASAVAQIASAWLFKALRTNNKWLNLFSQLVFIAPTNVAGLVAGAILPRNPDFFLDNVVFAKRRPNP